jgi:single-strand DNA-binding protein
VWGSRAEHVSDSLRRGDGVVILGRWSPLRSSRRPATTPAARSAKLQVVVEEIGPSLRWAVALPTKTGKPNLQAVPDTAEPPF